MLINPTLYIQCPRLPPNLIFLNGRVAKEILIADILDTMSTKCHVSQSRQRRKQDSLLFFDMRSQPIEIHRSDPLPHIRFFDADQNIRFRNTETMLTSIVDLLAQIGCTVRRPQEQFRRATLECKLRAGNSTRYMSVWRANIGFPQFNAARGRD